MIKRNTISQFFHVTLKKSSWCNGVRKSITFKNWLYLQDKKANLMKFYHHWWLWIFNKLASTDFCDWPAIEINALIGFQKLRINVNRSKSLAKKFSTCFCFSEPFYLVVNNISFSYSKMEVRKIDLLPLTNPDLGVRGISTLNRRQCPTISTIRWDPLKNLLP